MVIANGAGHCHTCYEAGRGKEGEALAAALEAAKKRVNSPDNTRVAHNHMRKVSVGQTKKAVHEMIIVDVDFPGTKDIGPDKSARNLTEKQHPPDPDAKAVVLTFGGEDLTLHERILKMARDDRRTIDQQILWMVDAAFRSMAGIKA